VFTFAATLSFGNRARRLQSVQHTDVATQVRTRLSSVLRVIQDSSLYISHAACAALGHGVLRLFVGRQQSKPDRLT